MANRYENRVVDQALGQEPEKKSLLRTILERIPETLAAGAEGYAAGAGGAPIGEAAFASGFSSGYKGSKENRRQDRIRGALETFKKSPAYGALSPEEKTMFDADPLEGLRLIYRSKQNQPVEQKEEFYDETTSAEIARRAKLKVSPGFKFSRASGDAIIRMLGLDRPDHEATKQKEISERQEKNRYRNYFLDMEQRDPVIKEVNKQNLSLGTISKLSEIAKSGNTIAFNSLGTKVARGMGEVGVLTDQDVVRYVRSGRLDRKAADALLQWTRGVPTEATINEINQIVGVLQDTYTDKIQPRYDRYITSYANNEGIPPEEFSIKIGLPYSGNTSINNPKNNVAGFASDEVPTFASENDAQRAEDEGRLKPGTKVIIGGVPGTWQ